VNQHGIKQLLVARSNKEMCVTCCCLGHSCVNDYSLFFVGLTLWLSAAFFPFLENGSWKNLKSIDAKTRVRIH
jgi:hypothetical protein